MRIAGLQRCVSWATTAISNTLRKLGHKAHPDKFERSAAHSQAAHLNADCWTPAVRFLGHYIDADGSTREDTKQRLASARQIWWKLKKKFQSSVCHCVFVSDSCSHGARESLLRCRNTFFLKASTPSLPGFCGQVYSLPVSSQMPHLCLDLHERKTLDDGKPPL